jgi:uncharacterized damage-inducible protein DinB
MDLLLGYVAQQRYGMKLTAYGLTDEQARQAPTVSTLSVGGLLKHTIAMERGWMETVLRKPQKPFEESVGDYQNDFTFKPEDTLEALLAEQEKVGAQTERIAREIGDLEYPVPVPKGVPWYPPDLDAWTLRWVLLHLVEELARHAGHADLVRESVDGATTFPLMAAAEGWPASEWLQPWEPAKEPTP